MLWSRWILRAILLGLGLLPSGLADAEDAGHTKEKGATRTHYDVLRIPRDCTIKEIKKSYRKLALELHPDKVNNRRDGLPGNCSSHEELKELFLRVQEAYAVLSSATQRLQYDLLLSGVEYVDYTEPEIDRYMPPGKTFRLYVKTPSYRMAFATVFPQLTIPAIAVEIKFTLSDTIKGVENHKHTFHRREICGACHGTGSKNGDVEICSFCSGVGQAPHLFHHKDGEFEQMTNTTCGMCDGLGFIPKERCDVCGGKGVVIGENSLFVSLPPGFSGDKTETVPKSGHVGRDSRIGDVALTIAIDLPDGWEIMVPRVSFIMPYKYLFASMSLGSRRPCSLLWLENLSP